MKHIKKKPEPASLIAFKQQDNDDWQAEWVTLTSSVKQDIHRSLLEEQGALCCYCEGRITVQSSHIEHLHPQSRPPVTLQLEYSNLFASCQRELQRREPLHCGALKEDWYDAAVMVSPLDRGCEQRFKFTAAGEIYPRRPSDAASAETIRRLGLNIDKLQALRRKAIEAMLEGLDDLSSASDVEDLIKAFNERDTSGEFTEFSTAITDVLKTFS
jgi:uncharacterized protein (TIGR02646 family)